MVAWPIANQGDATPWDRQCSFGNAMAAAQRAAREPDHQHHGMHLNLLHSCYLVVSKNTETTHLLHPRPKEDVLAATHPPGRNHRTARDIPHLRTYKHLQVRSHKAASVNNCDDYNSSYPSHSLTHINSTSTASHSCPSSNLSFLLLNA